MLLKNLFQNKIQLYSLLSTVEIIGGTKSLSLDSKVSNRKEPRKRCGVYVWSVNEGGDPVRAEVSLCNV